MGGNFCQILELGGLLLRDGEYANFRSAHTDNFKLICGHLHVQVNLIQFNSIRPQLDSNLDMNSKHIAGTISITEVYKRPLYQLPLQNSSGSAPVSSK